MLDAGSKAIFTGSDSCGLNTQKLVPHLPQMNLFLEAIYFLSWHFVASAKTVSRKVIGTWYLFFSQYFLSLLLMRWKRKTFKINRFDCLQQFFLRRCWMIVRNFFRPIVRKKYFIIATFGKKCWNNPNLSNDVALAQKIYLGVLHRNLLLFLVMWFFY